MNPSLHALHCFHSWFAAAQFGALKPRMQANSSKCLSWMAVPFPSPSRSQPSPSGQTVKIVSGSEPPLPSPLHSFSNLNISTTFTCACHTDFSTLSTSNIAAISKKSKGFSESIKVYVHNGIFHSAVFPGTFSLPAGDPELRNDF